MDSIVLKSFPMPPRLSECFVNNPRSKFGRTKSREYELFERLAQGWAWKNAVALNMARDLTTDLSPGLGLQLELVLCFPEDRIILKHDQKQNPKKKVHPSTLRKKGQAKRMDVDNRLKAFQDVFASLLAVDDSDFWCIIARKKPLKTDALGEYVDIKMSLVEMDIAEEWIS